MKAIVYTSETGHTAEYARILSRRAGLPACSLSEAKRTLPAGTPVFYLGWLMAGGVKGYKAARRQFDVRGAAAVGMTAAPNGKLWDQAREQGGMADGVRAFYLQGGYEGARLKGLYRAAMRPIEKSAIRDLSQKKDRSPAEEDTLELFRSGGSRVREENLEEIVAWLAAELPAGT